MGARVAGSGRAFPFRVTRSFAVRSQRRLTRKALKKCGLVGAANEGNWHKLCARFHPFFGGEKRATVTEPVTETVTGRHKGPKQKRPVDVSHWPFKYFYGAPGRIRTSDPQVRSLVLYPAELRARREANIMVG
jgi:hypothetical protein